MIVTLTEGNFADTIKASQPVLIHFWSDFCGPCKVQSRVLEQLDEKHRDRIVLGEINSQKRLDWTEAFGVRSTPTTLLFHEGELVARLTGVHSLSKIEQLISKTVMLT